MKKINVVGTSGSGKSTFSRMLAHKLNYPHLEMDALFWKSDWTESPDDEFFAKLENQLSKPEWVLDGNYNRTRPIKWAEVDTVIWLDYSFPRTLSQALKRAFVRSVTKKEIWPDTGNVETFSKSFFSKDSIIIWTLKTYKSNRTRYLDMFEDPKYSHITFVRITSPRMAKKFISEQLK